MKRACLILGGLLALASAGALEEESYLWSFDRDAVGKLPG